MVSFPNSIFVALISMTSILKKSWGSRGRKSADSSQEHSMQRVQVQREEPSTSPRPSRRLLAQVCVLYTASAPEMCHQVSNVRQGTVCRTTCHICLVSRVPDLESHGDVFSEVVVAPGPATGDTRRFCLVGWRHSCLASGLSTLAGVRTISKPSRWKLSCPTSLSFARR